MTEILGALNLQVLLGPLIVLLIPVAVNYLKKLIPEKLTFLIPAVAMILGPIADALGQWATGVGIGPVPALLYGLGAIGVREIVNQLVGRMHAPPA